MPFAGPIVMGIDANPDSLTSTAPTSSLFSAAWEFVKRIVGIVVLVCGARLTKEIHQTCVSQSVLMAMTTLSQFITTGVNMITGIIESNEIFTFLPYMMGR